MAYGQVTDKRSRRLFDGRFGGWDEFGCESDIDHNKLQVSSLMVGSVAVHQDGGGLTIRR